MTSDWRRKLLFHGTLLFLLGLLTGLLLPAAGPALANPRAVLAGHLEGVMNGTFLLAVGLFFSETNLSERARKAAYGLLLFGTYANWFTTTFTGIAGTGKATPIAGAGHEGHPLAEMFVFGMLGAVTIAMIAGVVLLLTGLRAPAPATAAR